MENYYSLLGIDKNASPQDIKRAFREKAKRMHPDIAGNIHSDGMRKLIIAYEALSDPERRYEYDKVHNRFARGESFDYRTYLRENPEDPACQAKLIFFDLLHLEEEEALEIWEKFGGLDFRLEDYLDREDWMDCLYILAEELEIRRRYYEAFILLAHLVKEERRRPYFRHFSVEIENTLKELARLRLKSSVDNQTFVECMEILLELGFSPRDEARWLRSMAETLVRMGEMKEAEAVFREALNRDPALPNVTLLRRKLNV